MKHDIFNLFTLSYPYFLTHTVQMKLYVMIYKDSEPISLLNPHGSDETLVFSDFYDAYLNLLNPHGSDETYQSYTHILHFCIFLTHTVQMKLVVCFIKPIRKSLLNPHGSDETSKI